MFYNHHFIGMHWLWWIVLAVVIVWIVFYIFPYRAQTVYKEDVLDILKKRFARGEIEHEEYEERKHILNND